MIRQTRLIKCICISCWPLHSHNHPVSMMSFFRFVDKRAIYRWYNLIRTCAGECDRLFHWQHKLCATFSANVNINYRLPINQRVRVMVFKATFNNISVISWRLVLLVEETRVPRENHRPVASHWQTLSLKFVSSAPRHERGSNSQLQWR
jgi:hypothetical protein